MELFFSKNINNDIVILDRFESKHCIKVLRKKIGDKINIVNGKGVLYSGVIVSDNYNECHVKIVNKINNYDKKDYYVHIAISPIKNHNRLEWFIEKSVEIGIDEISFIACDRTLRNTIKMNRILNTSISAMKQTLKASLPRINNICTLDEFIKNNKESNKFICHLEYENKSDLFEFKDQFKSKKKSCILIGPEGDFTLDEIKKAELYDFVSINLGKNRLRTETAGIVACHLLNLINIYD